MKKFILMLIVCLILSSSIVYGTGTIKSAYFNEGLTLAVNNQAVGARFITVELEGEQWGRNYISVADFVKALNDYAGINATVDFDPKTQTIIVDSKVIESNVESITKTGGDIVSEQPEVPLNKYGLPDFSNYTGEKPELQNNGTYRFFLYNGEEYILLSGRPDLPLKLPSPYRFECPIINGKVSFIVQMVKKSEDGTTVIIEDVPCALYSDSRNFCIQRNYYLNTILPLTQGAE